MKTPAPRKMMMMMKALEDKSQSHGGSHANSSLGMCACTFKNRDMVVFGPVRVLQVHFIVAVPAQQLIHGAFSKALRHKQTRV